MKNLLIDKTKFHFSKILSTYGLVVKSVDDTEVVMYSNKYAIIISCDVDGLRYSYCDISNKESKCYNLGLYLINKRRNCLKFISNDCSDRPLEEYLDINLNLMSENLLKCCQDILDGNIDWLREYSWPSTITRDYIKEIIIKN